MATTTTFANVLTPPVGHDDLARHRAKSVSPKKFLIQKYQEDLEAMMIKNYSSRLFLTWIYTNPNPPLLSPVPNINISMSSQLSLPLFIHQQSALQTSLQADNNKTLSPLTSPLPDIERYINRLLDTVSNVIHFFYIQNCKKHTELVQQQFKNNPSHIYNKQTANPIHSNHNNADYNSIFIGCIYYADLFVRKNTRSSISILDLLITSIIITIKMWIEEKMSVNKYMSKIFGISLSHINQQEINFLKSIDYQIFLHEKDIKLFTDIIHKSYVQKSNNNNNNNIPAINITPSNNNNYSNCINITPSDNNNNISVPSHSASNTPVLSQATGSACIIISPDIRSSSSSPSIAQPLSCLTTPTIRYNNNNGNHYQNHYHHQHYSSSASMSPISIVPSSPNTPQQISKHSQSLISSSSPSSNKRKPLFQNIQPNINKIESYSQPPNNIKTNTNILVLCSTKHNPNQQPSLPNQINRTTPSINSNNNINGIIHKNNQINHNHNHNHNNNININTTHEEDEDYYNFDIVEEPRKRIKEIISF